MKETRRSFLKRGIATSLLMGIGGINKEDALARNLSAKEVTEDVGRCCITSTRDTLVEIFSKDITSPIKLILIADTHLWMSDKREDPYRQYSNRMAKAYNQTKHFATLSSTNPKEQFEKTMEIVKKKQPDALCLLGDIFSFPSEAAIEWAKLQLDQSGIDYYYISGNHDWHYEGLPGSEISLRKEWTQKRLAPLYKGHNPLIYSVNIKGLRIIMLDDSTYEILPEQLEFFKKQIRQDHPTLLMSHCPLYAPGFPVSYGCGHPKWNAKADHGYKIERRQQWPVEGHKPETYEFWNEVVKGCHKHHLLASFAGHVHRQTSSTVKDWTQFTLKPNFSGAYLEVLVKPMSYE